MGLSKHASNRRRSRHKRGLSNPSLEWSASGRPPGAPRRRRLSCTPRAWRPADFACLSSNVSCNTVVMTAGTAKPPSASSNSVGRDSDVVIVAVSCCWLLGGIGSGLLAPAGWSSLAVFGPVAGRQSRRRFTTDGTGRAIPGARRGGLAGEHREDCRQALSAGAGSTLRKSDSKSDANRV